MKEQQEKYDLPKGWKLVKLKDIAHINMGQSPPSNTYNYNKIGLPFFQGKTEFGKIYPTVVKYCSKPIKVAKKNDILISVRAPIGATNVATEECCIGRGLASINTFEIIPHLYVMWYLRLNENKIMEFGTGSIFKAISKDTLENINIPVSTVKEAERIVFKIEELFSKLDEAELGLMKSRREFMIYRQALLKSSFEGQLTKNWRKDLFLDAHQELADIKQKREDKYTADIKKIKAKKRKIDFEFNFKRDDKISGWAISSLDNLIDINARIGWRGLTKREYTNEGALFLSVHSLNYGKNVVFKDANFISIERYNESPEIQLKKNDILLCKDGAGIGKVGIIKKLPGKTTVNSSLLVIDAREVFNPEFLYYFFLGPDMQRLVNEKISGSAIPHLFQKDIKKFNLKVPPILEQNKIVEILESRFTLVDNLDKTVGSVLKEVAALKHSILKKAFIGKLVNFTADDSVENLVSDIKEKKKLYLENQKELNRNKPKQEKKMEEKKSVLSLLKESDKPISAQDLWEKSTSDGDIERFYTEIKEIYHQIDELKSKTESLLTLKNENK